MIISWYGEACFLLEAGGTRVLIEPPTKDSGIAPPRAKSDVLIYSKPRGEKPEEGGAFIVDGPGEYEIKGVNILGIAAKNTTIYNIEMDGIKIAHLGFLEGGLDNDSIELIDDPEIVLVPAGGLKGEILDAEAAMKAISQLEPSIAIPMLYDIKGLKTKRAPLSAFIKESEAKNAPQPKLTIKKKELTEEETKIVILEKT